MPNQVVPPSPVSRPTAGHPKDNEPSRTAWGGLLLVALSVFLCLLGLYQWMELLVVARGGSTACSISANVDCSAVWNSRLANAIHSAVKVPVAGLGLMFGLTALAFSLVVMIRALKRAPLGPERAGVRLTALVGIVASVLFASASAVMGKLCLTCLGTYALTFAFFATAWKMLPGSFWPPSEELRKGGIRALGLSVFFYLLMIYPGIKTQQVKMEAKLPSLPTLPAPNLPPKVLPTEAMDASVQAGSTPLPGANPSSQLTQFLASLSPAQRKTLQAELVKYKARTIPQKAMNFSSRYVAGPADAPVRVTEFADIRCSHCKELEHTLRTVQGISEPGAFSVEPRWFPLAAACNSEVGRPDSTGVCCAGARALVCLEGQNGYWNVRKTLYDEQDTLTESRVMEVASQYLPQAELRRCMESPQTKAKLAADVAYASAYGIQGTPLVLVNGKEAPNLGSFLYVMSATRGNLDAPEIQDILNNP